MVSILPTERSPWQAISNSIGRGLSDTLPQAAQQRSNRDALQKSLGNIKDLASNPNATNLDIMLSAMQASAGIPGSERYMAQVLPELLKQAEVNRSSKASFPGEMGQPRTRDLPESMPQRQALPDRGFGENRQSTSNQNNGYGSGHIPQEATTGQNIPLTSPSEKPAAIKKLIEDNKKIGRMLTIPEATAEFDAYQEDIKRHNTEVENERKRRVAAQKNYGQMAVDTLNKVYTKKTKNANGQSIRVPAATPEIEAVFKQIGEKAAESGKSEGAIEQLIAKETKDFSDNIANIQNDLSSPRTQNYLQRKFNGDHKDIEQASADLRTKLNPLLKLGLYDTSRNLLSGLGYYPEEIDSTINAPSEREKIVLNKVPNAKQVPTKPYMPNPTESVRDLEPIKQGLKDLKEANPNFSLVLARKAFEEKKYDSRMFKDALNELEEEGFKLEPDQEKQRGILDTPPLSTLQKILHGLGLIGR